MARRFFLEAPDPDSAFALLRSWAQASGYLLNGDGSEGSFSRVRRNLSRGQLHLDALLFPNVSGVYSIRKAEVTLITEEAPPPSFIEGLVAAGLRRVSSQ
jgi:hypothetical protein